MRGVMQPDVVLWACTWLRARLGESDREIAAGVVVTDREPVGDSLPDRLVVISESGSNDRDLLLSDMTLRVSTLAGTPEMPDEANELARLVHALFRECAGEGSVAAVVGARGVMWAGEDHSRARRFSLFDLVIVGDIVDLP